MISGDTEDSDVINRKKVGIGGNDGFSITSVALDMGIDESGVLGGSFLDCTATIVANPCVPMQSVTELHQKSYSWLIA